MPYMGFPPNWPVSLLNLKSPSKLNPYGSQMFTPKDKLAEWFEYYAMAMELNIWTSTNLVESSWSDKAKKWTVTIERKKGDQLERRE